LGDGFELALISLVVGAFGIYFGFGLGNMLGSRATSKKEYWKYNAIAYAGFIVLAAFIWALGLVVLIFFSVGGLAGVIAGLRMGYGQAVGPWKAHDRFMNLHPDEKPKRPARTFTWPWARKKDLNKGWANVKPADEAPSDEPEFISVSGPAPDRKSRRSK
jgi:hypothetical protein